jgi:hypothetical protein
MNRKHSFDVGADAAPTSVNPAGVERHARELPEEHRPAATESGGPHWRRWWRSIRTSLDAAADARRGWRRLHI